MKIILLLTFLTLADASLLGFLFGSHKHDKKEPTPTNCADHPKSCPKTPYRSYDGSCNNLENPTWGKANTTYGRLLPATYSDGISSLPKAKSGKDLPNARAVSMKIFTDKNVLDTKWTLDTMQFGQLFVHDVAKTSGVPDPNIVCCSNGKNVDNPHPRCCNIPVPPKDEVHPGQECLNFIRTINSKDINCTPPDKPATPMSVVTAYTDASFVYGSSEAEANKLRTFKDGKLKSEMRNGQEWLPPNPNPRQVCQLDSDTEPCYVAGDSRVNQNTQLTMLQIFFMRLHNKLADQLHKINKKWKDEKLYQETRRIVNALYQNVVFYELLPIYMGRENMRKAKILYPDAVEYVDDYDPCVNAEVTVEFSTVAGRVVHSAIAGFLQLVSHTHEDFGAIRLSDWFNKPSILERGSTCPDLARGIHTQPEMAMDKEYHNETTIYLFRGNNENGTDLRAIDVQRARDHGAPFYNDLREYCGLPRAKEFKDFTDYIPESVVKIIEKFYENPNDVDATVGGALEKAVEGSQLGPTYLCCFNEQMYRTRVGDRFFFENGKQAGSFTLKQLQNIRKITIASIFCAVGGVKKVQRRALDLISDENPLVPCSEIPQIDIKYWKDSSFSL